MAKANTYTMEQGGYLYKDKCEMCDEKPNHRAFYYPTYMNGDARWLGDFCEKHKMADLKSLTEK